MNAYIAIMAITTEKQQGVFQTSTYLLTSGGLFHIVHQYVIKVR
jgi:hypothetical protein